MLSHVVRYKFTDVSKKLAASNVRAITSETSVNFYHVHGATSGKTVIFK
jgi:hypothetical protein